MTDPTAPTSYTIINHKLFTYVEGGVVITDTRDPRVLNFTSNEYFAEEYPTTFETPWRQVGGYGKHGIIQCIMPNPNYYRAKKYYEQVVNVII